MPNHDDILRLEGISKAYPGVKALDNVGFSLKKGEVHALVGENGAGKSTLIKCISGAIRPDSGKIFLDNKEFLSIGPKDTIEHGIVTVYQELNLIPSLSVAENVFVGERRGGKVLYNRQKVEQDCKKILEDFHIDIDATAIVNELSVAQRQLVEIVRAISRNVRILILDEPTSSLTVHETQFLFDTIRRLKQNGVTIIYISHIFEETFRYAGWPLHTHAGNFQDEQGGAHQADGGQGYQRFLPDAEHRFGRCCFKGGECDGPGCGGYLFRLTPGGDPGLCRPGWSRADRINECNIRRLGKI